MDTVGLLLVVIAASVYYLTRKTNPRLIPWLCFAGGVGVGIVAAAWFTVLFVL